MGFWDAGYVDWFKAEYFQIAQFEFIPLDCQRGKMELLIVPLEGIYNGFRI
ncbi:MAG: hypothetical protein ACREUM_07920 [Nitrosospira sp.]